MIGQFLQQLYNTVDGVVVGNFVSQEALAAVGGCGSLTMALLAVCFGMGNGCAVLVSQLYGARREEELRRSASTVLIMMGILGILISVLGFLLARPLLSGIMNIKDPSVLEMAVDYFAIYCLGLVFQYFYNAIAFVLRAVGDSRATLYFLCVTAFMNLGLDLLFVIVFGWVSSALLWRQYYHSLPACCSAIYIWSENTRFSAIRVKNSYSTRNSG
jgi:Na+-driven multidrug efflux pump